MLGIYEGGALIVGDLKYIEGLQGPDWWYGPHSPNCTMLPWGAPKPGS